MLLDTHFVIWVAQRSRRLEQFPWMPRYRPWIISPITLLEIQFLGEIGRIEVEDAFFAMLREDARFVLDEPGFDALIRAALPLSWTRDPFDRLLAAHSLVRRMPLCTLDRTLRKHHALLPAEL